MQQYQKILLFLLIMTWSQVGVCWFHFEPGIGYNRGHRQAQKAQGIGLTSKIGIDFTNFFMLADVGYHNLQIASTPSATATDMGLCLGGDFGNWRFWFTYLVAASVKTESSGVVSEYNGDGLKLGMSGKLSNRTYMNLEVRFIDLKELNGEPIAQIMDMALLSVSWKFF